MILRQTLGSLSVLHLFAMQDVDTGGDDDDNAYSRVQIRNITPYEVS